MGSKYGSHAFFINQSNANERVRRHVKDTMGTSNVEAAQAKVKQALGWVETCQRAYKEALPSNKKGKKEQLEGAKQRLKAAREELAQAKKMARK